MDKVAKLPARDRAALFGESAAGRGIAELIIEKDFWVCWTLRRLFTIPKGAAATFVFKGGTSLSKAFGAIRRFSEDIDLSFDRTELGYAGEKAPEQDGLSKKKVERLIEELQESVRRHISDNLYPALHAAIVNQLGEPAGGGWSLDIDGKDAQTVNFRYPPVFAQETYGGLSYITPRVRLEFGARGDSWPTENKVVRAYAAEDFPNFFENADSMVSVLSARRTFWEKATLLHAEAHRPADKETPQYLSRHFYDLAMLDDTAQGAAAIADLALLKLVADHKAIFFRSGWANYDTARPGTLRLVPDQARVRDLGGDYRAMAAMMFDEPPAFEDILARIKTLQDTINS
jgi:hypothetical protein